MPGSIAFVTIDLGANDLPDTCDAVTDPRCVAVARAAIATNLPTILAALREAAGPDVPIAGMTYYDPPLALWFQDPALAHASVDTLILPLNAALTAVYQAAGSPVADVQGAFATTDFTLVDGVPRNVTNICAWTWMCAPPPGPDIHPNAAGYGVIARAFEAVLP